MPRVATAVLIFALAGSLLFTLGLQKDVREVTIKNMRFDPETVEVKVGQTVRWTNKDDRDHTVTGENDTFKSGNLRSGKRFEHKFDKPGKFPYACSYHPRMKGTVNVSK